jgi:hypothetical protein
VGVPALLLGAVHGDVRILHLSRERQAQYFFELLPQAVPSSPKNSPFTSYFLDTEQMFDYNMIEHLF